MTAVSRTDSRPARLVKAHKPLLPRDSTQSDAFAELGRVSENIV